MAFREFTGQLDAPSMQQPTTGKFREFTGQLDPEPMTDREAWESSMPVRALRGIEGPAITLLKMVGPDSIKKQLAEIDQLRESGMKKRGNEGFDWAGMMGSLIPGAAIGGGVAKAMGSAPAVIKGIASGAATSAAQPLRDGQDELSSEKVNQAIFGGAVGGAIPLVGEGVKAVGRTVSNFAKPFTEGGREKILKAFLQRIIPEDKLDDVLSATRNAQELVPGSKPTVGQAVSRIPEATALARHQDIVSRLPEASPNFAAREAAQAGARKSAIGTIAKTPGDLQAQDFIRDANAKINYGKAFPQSVQTTPELQSLLARPAMKDALKEARTMALNRGEKFSTDSVKDLHFVKTALDDMVKNPERFGIGATKTADIRSLREQLIRHLGPDYAKARSVYSADSNIINRMKVGQQLTEALESPLGTSERSGVYANAVRNAPSTIKKATDGAQVADDLAKILTAQEMGTVNAVGSDLARNDVFKRLARQTNLSGADAIPGRIDVHLPNLLSREATIANAIMKAVGQNAETKIAKRAGAAYLDPANFTRLMSPDVPPRYRAVLDAMMQQAPGVAGAQVGRNY